MSAAQERKKKKLQVSRAFANFTDRTGMHAVSTISKEKTILKRSAWACLLLTAVVMLGIQIHGLSKKLLSRPTKTKVELITEPNATFPVVSFCNLNPVKKSILDYIATSEGRAVHDQAFGSVGGSSVFYKRMLDLRYLDKGTFEVTYFRPDAMTYLAKLLEDNSTEKFMYSFREMLLECKFEGKDCRARFRFIPFFSPRFGSCFAFDFEAFIRDMEPYHKFRADLTSVLELTLNADASSYFPGLAPAVGFLILFNARDKPPIPKEEGFIAAPGSLTKFGLRKTELRRLPPPYGKCDPFISRKDNEHTNMYFKTFNYTKPTQGVCLRTCEQLQVMKNCNCFSILHGNLQADAFTEFQRAKERPCLGGKEWSCHEYFIQQIQNGENKYCNEMCPYPECNTTKFKVSQSTGVWPDEFTIKLIQKEYEEDEVLPAMNTSEFRRNVLRVLIKFDDLDVIMYKTEVAYDWLDFLSDLGGQGGLWLGISVFTICEMSVMIFEFVAVIFRNITYYCSRKKQKTKGEAEEKDIDCQNECNVEV